MCDPAPHQPREIVIPSPAWLESALPTEPVVDVVERMRVAVGLAERNVAEGTGGPFGAGVFVEATGELIAAGVNVVVESHCSHAHAEMMAVGLAQRKLGTHDLASAGLGDLQLVSSCEPCAMCMGATVWSGVRSLVVAARDSDARSIGFDEGPKVEAWGDALRERGIAVTTDVLRDEAVAVLRGYAADGHKIYNAGS
ncbi:MAG: nucleoside deaminase [Planctomycetota bacterium]